MLCDKRGEKSGSIFGSAPKVTSRSVFDIFQTENVCLVTASNLYTYDPANANAGRSQMFSLWKAMEQSTAAAPQMSKCFGAAAQMFFILFFQFSSLANYRHIFLFRHRFTSNRKKQHKFVGNIIPHSEIGKCGLCASLGANVLHTIEGAFLTSKTSPHLVPSAERVHVETCTRFVVRALPSLKIHISQFRGFAFSDQHFLISISSVTKQSIECELHNMNLRER